MPWFYNVWPHFKLSIRVDFFDPSIPQKEENAKWIYYSFVYCTFCIQYVCEGRATYPFSSVLITWNVTSICAIWFKSGLVCKVKTFECCNTAGQPRNLIMFQIMSTGYQTAKVSPSWGGGGGSPPSLPMMFTIQHPCKTSIKLI